VAEIEILSMLPREFLQNSRSVVSMTSADYRRALALRELAAVTTGFPQYLLAPEIALILDAVPNLHRRLLFDTLWNTGARINEALALKPADINLNATRPFIILHTLKQRLRPQPGRPSKKDPIKRAVPLLDESFTMRLRDGLATFTRHRTKPVWDITDDTARNWLSDALQECRRRGISFSIPEITPKTFRHSYAMHLAMNAVEPMALQGYMGHKSFKSTQHYLRVFALDLGHNRSGIQFTYPVDFLRLPSSDSVTPD